MDKDSAIIEVARKQPAGPPPPPGFKKYEKSSGAGGVMGMLEGIISEAKTMEADAIKAETDAQKAYESFVKDTNASMEEKSREITTKSEEKAAKEVKCLTAMLESPRYLPDLENRLLSDIIWYPTPLLKSVKIHENLMAEVGWNS